MPGGLRSPLNRSVLYLLALVAGFYLWTATSSANPIRLGGDKTDYYNLQSDAFLHGQLSLLVRPAKELLALPNPYDPVANEPYRLHDLSLYDGHYYLSWGPTPALMLFIPFRALALGDMPENLAVVLFSLGGLLFSVRLLRILLRRFLPDTPAWLEVVAVVALAFSNVAPFILRRPAVYEVAISAGYCFVFVGLYLLASGALAERPSLPRLGLGSLSLGLAWGCRPPLLLVGATASRALLVVRRSAHGTHDSRAPRRHRGRAARRVRGGPAPLQRGALRFADGVRPDLPVGRGRDAHEANLRA